MIMILKGDIIIWLVKMKFEWYGENLSWLNGWNGAIRVLIYSDSSARVALVIGS